MTIVPPALRASLRVALSPRRTGRVTRIVGLRVEVEGIEAAVGDAVRISWSGGTLDAEVVALQNSSLACMPLGDLR
ncbi:MAG TPA: EscN/YscN/HrcN family type III secretion system ATPase, partial [Acidimicrobiales bacterium]|nr:EscN/YscN/HrcN family type III secretion system ATPase [Acidimicrobiales bacterium]